LNCDPRLDVLMLYTKAIGFSKLQHSLQSAEHLTCFDTYTGASHGALLLSVVR